MMSVIAAGLGLVLLTFALMNVHFGHSEGRHAESGAETISVRQLYAKLGKEEFGRRKHAFARRPVHVASAAA